MNRVGLPAGSRRKTLARAGARPFRAESSHRPATLVRAIRGRAYVGAPEVIQGTTTFGGGVLRIGKQMDLVRPREPLVMS